MTIGVTVRLLTLVALVGLMVGAPAATVAQQADPQPMTFFITSVGIADGARR